MCLYLDFKCHLHEHKNRWVQHFFNEIPKSFEESHWLHICKWLSHEIYHLCPDYTQKLTEEMNNWYSPTCLLCLFQYNLITNENDIAEISGESDKYFCYLSDTLFMPFELNDKDHRAALCDIDPDLKF